MDSNDGHDGVHDISDDGDDEGVANTGRLEKGGSVVEDKVDTGELLPALECDAGPSTKTIAIDSITEAVDVCAGTGGTLSLKGLYDETG